jgi:hypothetical protein
MADQPPAQPPTEPLTQPLTQPLTPPPVERAVGEPASSASGRRYAEALLVLGAVGAVALTALFGIGALDSSTGQGHRDRHAVLPAGVTRVVVSASSGDIRLTGTPPGRVVVDGRLSGTGRLPTMTVDVHGPVATLRASCPWTFFLSCGATIDIAVPPGVAVEAHTSSGDLRATDVRGPVDLRTSSGDVRASGGAGTMTLHTSSGDVRGSGLRATSVDARSSSGDVTIAQAVAPDQVTAWTSSGDVEVSVPSDATTYAVRARTSSGKQDVQVRTDPDSVHRIDLRSGSGDVSVGYPRTP